MAKSRRCEVLVVGAGPGGYVAAIRAAQLGLDTIIVEGSRAGGTCLIRGCIPSKAIIHAAERFEALAEHAAEAGHMGIKAEDPKIEMEALIDWKDGIVDRLNKGVETLLAKAGADLLHGWATFRDAKTCDVQLTDGDVVRIQASNVILATGSSPIDLPFMPIDGDRVISSTEALELDNLPDSFAVVGGGYIGLELGCALRRLGSEVTVIEGMESVLPMFDAELRRPLERWMKRNGLVVHTGCSATGTNSEPNGMVTISWTDQEGGASSTTVDKVLVTVGRRPNIDGWGLDSMGVAMDESGRFVAIDERCGTNMRGVYAIGDLAGEPMLAHKASAQGEMVAEIIAGRSRAWDKVAVPAIVFTEPEIVSVGMNPDQAAAECDVVVGKFPLAGNGRALTLEADKSGGFVRVVARSSDHLILGIQAVGSHIAELSGEFVLALEMGATLEDVAQTVHAHPTMTESFHESILKSLGHAIHSV